MNAPLSFNGQITEGIKMREKEQKYSRMIFDARKERLEMELLTLYLDALKKYTLYKVSREILSRAEKLVTIFENTYEMGQISRLEYIDAIKETGKLRYRSLASERSFYESFYELAVMSGFSHREPEN